MEKQRIHLFLNRLLANYFVVHTKLYRYQWFAKGSHVIVLKQTFADFQDRWQKDLEDIAEHIIYLNGKPFATMVKFIKEASLKEAEADDLEKEMFSQIRKDLQTIIKEIEGEGMPIVREANDFYTFYFLLKLQETIRSILTKFHDINFD